MQTLAFLKDGLCRVADDLRDVAAARKSLVLPNQQQLLKRRGGAATSSGPEGFVQSQLLSPCPSVASAAMLLAGGSGSEGGVIELPDGTRLEAEQVATKARVEPACSLFSVSFIKLFCTLFFLPFVCYNDRRWAAVCCLIEAVISEPF